MPDVVLRHPKLKGQPIVVGVGLDGLVPARYADAGWEIDSKTEPAAAELELYETRQAAAAKNAEKARTLKPKFAPSSEKSASTTNTNQE